MCEIVSWGTDIIDGVLHAPKSLFFSISADKLNEALCHKNARISREVDENRQLTNG